jgi:hypothetical protein
LSNNTSEHPWRQNSSVSMKYKYDFKIPIQKL